MSSVEPLDKASKVPKVIKFLQIDVLKQPGRGENTREMCEQALGLY